MGALPEMDGSLGKVQSVVVCSNEGGGCGLGAAGAGDSHPLLKSLLISFE
jgi:hypothetical protein